MVAEEIDTAVIRRLLIHQYEQDTPFVILIDGLLELIQGRLVEPLMELETQLNADARGSLLDAVGLRIGRERLEIDAGAQAQFGFEDNPTATGFDQAPFRELQPSLRAEWAMPDNLHRRVVKARAFAVLGNASAGTVWSALLELFSEAPVASITDRTVTVTPQVAETSDYLDRIAAVLPEIVGVTAGVSLAVEEVDD